MKAIYEFPMRLQVFLSKSTPLSRRKAEEAIEQGRVEVNNEVVTQMGIKVERGDKVSLDGFELSIAGDVRCYMLNKPRGCVCTNYDPHQKNYARDYLRDVREPERLFSIGRLDKDSQGLLLFTDDGALANKIIHPSGKIVKTYQVQTKEKLEPAHLHKMREGIILPDNVLPYKIASFSIISLRVAEVRLESGKNREIRKLFENFGYTIEKLVRIKIGQLELGDLKEGHYRKLNGTDVEKIFQQ